MSNTAEVAVLDPHGDIIYAEGLERSTGLDNDDIFAYIGADEMIEICNRVKSIAKPDDVFKLFG